MVSGNISGDPFNSWAGPVSVAFGGEYRHEFYHVVGDAYGNGVSDLSPNNAEYPSDPLLDPVGGNNWYAGNYHNGRGAYNVYEAYIELNVPILDSETLGKANLNLAGRGTHYSTSGTVYTWKIGGTWNTPLSGVRLRAVTSRDVRAPNLSELFAALIATNVPNFTNLFTNPPTSVNITQSTLGNPNLTPEAARNTELGVVLSRPRLAAGLQLLVRLLPHQGEERHLDALRAAAGQLLPGGHHPAAAAPSRWIARPASATS